MLRSAMLVLGLTLILLLGPFQLHPPIGWVDPGLYIRWFLDPAGTMVPGGGDYHSARGPFVVPGSLLYWMFGVYWGQIALVLLFQLGAVVGIHLLIGGLVRGFALRALLTASIALNPVWIAAITRGYVDGPAMAFGFLAMAALLRAPGQWGALGAGAFGALAFLTHALGGGLVLAGIAVALLLLASHGRAPLGHFVAATAGGAGAVLFSCLMAAAAGFPLLFFVPAFEMVTGSLVGAGSSPFNLPFEDWLPGATRVALIPAAAWLALAAWRGTRREPASTRALVAMAATIIILHMACIVVWQGFMAQFPFYASYAWLALVPGIALLAARAEQQEAVPLDLVGAILAGSLAIALAMPANLRESTLFSGLAWALALACLGAVILAGFRGQQGLALVGLLGLLGAAGIGTRDTATVLLRPGHADFGAQQRALAEFRSFLDRTGGLAGPYLVWVGRDGLTELPGPPVSSTYALHYEGRTLRLNALDSLAASLGWDAFALGFHMPEIGVDFRLATLVDADPDTLTSLILLCGQPADCEGGRAALKRIGLRVEPVAAQTITVPRVPHIQAQRYLIALGSEQDGPTRAQMAAVLALVIGEPRPIDHLVCEPRRQQRVCRALFRYEDGRQEVREVEFEPVRGLFLPGPPGPAEPALAILDQAEAAPLCHLETRRIAFWFDRPEAVPHAPHALAAVQRLMTPESQDDALTCLENVAALYRIADMGWRTGYMPRIAMGCAVELAAARALAASMAHGLQDVRAAADLAAAEAASQRGDEASCLQRTGAVRAAWLSRFELAPPSR